MLTVELEWCRCSVLSAAIAARPEGFTAPRPASSNAHHSLLSTIAAPHVGNTLVYLCAPTRIQNTNKTKAGQTHQIMQFKSWSDYYCPCVFYTEAQKPSWHRGIAIQKVFARPESFCAKPLKLHWGVSGWSGKFPDSLESFQIVWIFSGLTGKFPNSLESFRTGWIFSGWSGKFFWLPGKFPASLDIFWMVQKVSG